MILEFELEKREGNKKDNSYAIKRKGLIVGSIILFPQEYQEKELTRMEITTR